MRSILTAAWAVLLCLLPLTTTAADNSPPADVLLILVDDLGYGDLSSYGANDLSTPHLDRLAARGMRFSQFYANCPVCSPTRAALLTGRFPDAVGVPGVIRTHASNSWGLLSPDAVLLPAVLNKAGYRTAMFGKWHLGLGEPNVPNTRGFDFFHGFLGDMMDDYFHHRRHGQNYMRLNRNTIDPTGHATDLFTDWTCRWLERYKHKEPFFIYLAYNAPHFPIQPPEDWLARYKTKHPDVPEKRARNCAYRAPRRRHRQGPKGTRRNRPRRQHTGPVHQRQRRLAAARPKQRMAPRRQAGHARGRHPRADVRAWPGRIKPGSKSDRVALTMDLFPTICEAAGAEHDKKIDGRSILPTLLGKPQPAEDRFLFWVRLEGGRRYQGRPYYAARHGDWKLLQNDPDEPLRLYNLKDDPKEQKDVSREFPSAYRRLKTALDAHIARCAKVPWGPPSGVGPGEIGRARPTAGKSAR